MMAKNLMLIVCCSFFVGCSSLNSISDTPNTSAEESDWNCFSGTQYSVPDYYSTKQIDKKHQVDSVYYVKDLRCKNSVNRCSY